MSLKARIVLILLVLILLAASAIFGVLTYWLGAEAAPASPTGQGRVAPAGYGFHLAQVMGRQPAEIRIPNNSDRKVL